MHFVRLVFLASCVTATTVFASAEQGGPVTLDFAPVGAPSASSIAAVDGKAAPMDESFGHYPMSVFGIASAIHKYDGTEHLDDGPIAYAIVAIRDWEHRFPHDPWIARELLAMQRVYEHAHTSEGDTYARSVAAWLQNDYPSSIFAASSRNDVAKRAQGQERPSRQRPAPEHAPSPLPHNEAPKPVTTDSAEPAAFHAARPSATPTQTPTPNPETTPELPSYAQPNLSERVINASSRAAAFAMRKVM